MSIHIVHANMKFKMRSTSKTFKQDKVNVAVEQNIDIQDEKYKQDTLIAELKRAGHAPKNNCFISIVPREVRASGVEIINPKQIYDIINQ
jgi:hypothetical protein